VQCGDRFDRDRQWRGQMDLELQKQRRHKCFMLCATGYGLYKCWWYTGSGHWHDLLCQQFWQR
jgi:hypothetical protein